MKIGIIGAGFWGIKHAIAIASTPDVKLVAASRTNQSALQEFTDRFGGAGYPDYRDLLADQDVEAIIIATPHDRHTSIVADAAQAGKHILLEKPMAPNLDECDQILKFVDNAGVKLMLGHVNHFIPAYRIAKEMLQSGELGEIVYGLSSVSKFWFEPNRRDWHLDRKTGGGMWLTVGIHCLDRLTWLVGSPIESVYAMLDTRFHKQNADDVGLVFVRYANGGTGVLESTGYKTGANKNLTELTCTKGILKISSKDGILLGRDDRWQPVPDSASDDPMTTGMARQMQEFYNYLTGDSPSPVSGEYARHIMNTAFLAEESAETQEKVTVPSPGGLP
jgi:predicted dehydrogenase